MTRALRSAGPLLAALFLALHLPFLPSSLEDLDSVNFALGLNDFDVGRHQPHPPGYPIFIAAARAVHVAGLSEVHALSVLGVIAGALAVVFLVVAFGEIAETRPPNLRIWLAVVLAAACPLFWITAARPLSDMVGLSAAIAVQTLALRSRTPRSLAGAALAAGVAAGIRSQVIWLTVPLLVYAVWRMPRRDGVRSLAAIAGAYAIGALLWLVPLVADAGGPGAYWAAFFNQGAEDLSGVTMLATRPTVRQFVRALQDTFVVPWGYWQMAAAVLAAASVGLARVAMRARGRLLVLVVAFGPYLVFHLLFQETVTSRYALPIVLPVAFLAIEGLFLLPEMPAAAASLALIGVAVTVDDRTLVRYARMEAPVFRMLGDMIAAGKEQGAAGDAPVLAMHRREEFDLRRPFQWVGSAMPQFAERLPSPPKHEWLELVKYWNRGGRQPVWFVADPLRSDLELVRSLRRPTLYRWPFEPTALVGGARPNELDWYAIEAPEWYLGEGWSLTPETAGIAREDRRGPGYGPILGWIRRRSGPMAIMVGGRNLADGGPPARVTVSIDGLRVDETTVPPGFFLRSIALPSLSGSGDYAVVAIEADSPELAIEQFDAQPAGRVMFGFGDGWHEREYNPATGDSWRWTSERASLRVRAGGHAVALTLRGEVEAASTSHVVIRAKERLVAEFDVPRSFARTVIVPADALSGEESALVIESSASYVPAESRWRSPDRRRLGLKLYECRVSQAS